MTRNVQICCCFILLFGWAALEPLSAQTTVALADPFYSLANQPDTQQSQQLVRVLEQLEKEYGVRFAFRANELEHQRVNRLKTPAGNADKPSLEELLVPLLEPLNLTFRRSQVDSYYIIRKKTESTSSVRKIMNEPSAQVRSHLGFKPPNLPPVQPNETVEKTITGKVSDLSTDEGLPGVNIVVKGTTVGTVTDVDGNYRFAVPDDAQALVFSSVGYTREEVIIGNQTTIDVAMAPDISTLSEVVVTSFGIKSTKEQLVYATQEVEGETLDQVGNPNVLNSLQGKVAGVSVNLSSGMPGRSPIVNIRGSRSITGNNQPLYVIDGLPVSGRPIDLNPSNIESMNVLKGATASALYGIRAANGAIIITTKQGELGTDGPQVTVGTFVSLDEVSFLPDLQRTYAQGNESLNTGSGISYGPRISEIGAYTNALGEEVVAQAYDHSDAFYETGYTWNTDVSIANGNEQGSYFVSLGRSQQEGVVPNTGLERINFKVNGQYNLHEKFTTNISFNYSELTVDDFPDLAGNTNYFRGIWEAPPSYDLAGTPIADVSNPYQQNYFRGGQNNPYWVVANNYRTSKTPRIFGNIFLKYQMLPSLSLNYRLGIDRFTTQQEELRELGTGDIGRTDPPSGGLLNLTDVASQNVNSNVYLSYDKQLEDFSLNVIAGNEIFDQRLSSNNTVGQNFVVGGFPNLSNATLINAGNSAENRRIVGFYGSANLGWQEKVYLNLTGRTDYVSNMPAANRSFFYPSVGTSIILTSLLPELQNVMSFAKLRASVAEVGQAGPLYVNNNGFRATNAGSFVFPFNGLSAFTQNSVRIAPDLAPENTRTLELGLDFRFVDDRIGIDYTYFNSRSENQIFQVPLPLSTGASQEIRNAGEISSQGHEIVLSLLPVVTNDFRWELTTNFLTYENTVEQLADGIEQIGITSPDGVNTIQVAQVGQDFPSFFGTSFLRDPQTNRVVVLDDESSPVHGMPIIDFENKVIGSPLPDFTMSFINSITYKNLSLSLQLDWRQGGQLFSQSAIETRFRGTSAETLSREEDVVIDGLKGQSSADGLVTTTGENDIAINQGFTYYTHIWQFVGAYQDALQDASFLRLRELSVSYTLPQTMVDRTFFGGLSVYFAGRNLFLITDSFVDPEVNYVETFQGSRPNSQGVEWNQLPQTRSYGLGVRATF